MATFGFASEKKHIPNKRELMDALSEELFQISTSLSKTLVQSMPIRLQAVIEANGMHTKY